MATVDLSQPTRPVADHLLAELPRRLTLTLPELTLAAELAGGAPLPFAHQSSRPGYALPADSMDPGTSVEDRAYATALATLPPARETLSTRGLLLDGSEGRSGLEPGLAGAVGLLAAGTLGLDLDVRVGEQRVRAWHRQGGPAVASLATADGLVFELSWFGVPNWPAELARVAHLPPDLPTGTSRVPDELCTPFALLDAVGEALRSGRPELVGVLVGNSSLSVSADGRPLSAADAEAALCAVHEETRGRLRVLAAPLGASSEPRVGLVSWLLLADAWHEVAPDPDDTEPRVRLRRVAPTGLAAAVAPVLEAVRVL